MMSGSSAGAGAGTGASGPGGAMMQQAMMQQALVAGSCPSLCPVCMRALVDACVCGRQTKARALGKDLNSCTKRNTHAQTRTPVLALAHAHAQTRTYARQAKTPRVCPGTRQTRKTSRLPTRAQTCQFALLQILNPNPSTLKQTYKQARTCSTALLFCMRMRAHATCRHSTSAAQRQ